MAPPGAVGQVPPEVQEPVRPPVAEVQGPVRPPVVVQAQGLVLPTVARRAAVC
jgi:hypothetical protein